MKKAVALIILVSAVLLSGCVERALVITSEPSGADVTVNQQWKGKTPYVVPFKHYGVYDIWIEHPGFEENGKRVQFYPLHVGEPVKAPGYQMVGADFVTEVLLPTTLYDQRNLHYVLERVDHADDLTDVLDRAAQLRTASRRRTEMRLEQDIQAGRTRPGSGQDEPSPTDAVDPYSSSYDYAAAPNQYGDYAEYSDIDATPPLPSEMPVFLP
ncbi:MAG: PEGA domain-containing protein [Planctomycetes bacterium]|nr:PEGA domain-containing protein [Planctomycetota bacterium]